MRIGRRGFLKLASASLAAYALAGVGLAWGRRVTRIDLGIGVRILFAPDTHIHGLDAGLVEEVNLLEPDLVLLGGDIYDRWSNVREVAETLKGIKAPKVGVLGNHEHWADTRYGKIPLEKGLAMLREAGVNIVFDSVIEVSGVRVAGIDWRDDPGDYDGIRLGKADILMAHSPDVFPHVEPSYRIVLAGHTHGGQLCLPGPRPVITNSVYGFKAGFYRRPDGVVMYVSRGAGHIIPLRLYCSRELVLIT